MTKGAVPAGDKVTFPSVVKATMEALRAKGGAVRLPAIPVKLTETGQPVPYKGVNALALSLAAERMGFTSSVWGSGKHLRATTGHLIEKGQKATHAVYAGLSEVPVKAKSKEAAKPEPAEQVDPFDPFAEPVQATADDKDDTDDAPESAKTAMRRVYRVFPLFNASQLNTAQAADAFDADVRHDKSLLPGTRHMQDRMNACLEERAKTEIGQQHPISDLERAWVLEIGAYLAYTTVGSQGVLTLPADLLADTTVFLKVVGTAQQCFDSIGLHHFNVIRPPRLVAVPVADHRAVEVVQRLEEQAAPPARTKRSQLASDTFDILSWFKGYMH